MDDSRDMSMEKGSNEFKLERKPKPERYCPACLGYGVKVLKDHTLEGKQAYADCITCKGSGWVGLVCNQDVNE